MKPARDVLAAHLADEAVLLDLNSKRYYRLNGSAAAIYRALEEGLDREGTIERILAAYDVDRDTAAAAVDETIKELDGRKLLEMPDPDTPR